MKKIFSRILTLVSLMCLLCGCSQLDPFLSNVGDSLLGMSDEKFLTLNENNNVDLVIIAGRHANANMYSRDLLESNVREIVERSIEYTIINGKYSYKANVHVVVSDSNPTAATLKDSSGANLILSGKTNEPDKARNNGVELADKILDALVGEHLIADDKEVDLAAALMEATAILNQSEGKEKHIIILDTGLCTSGYLDIRKLEFNKHDVDVILSSLSDAAFPNLNGITVKFYNLGNFGGDQQVMQNDRLFKDKFELFWEKFLQKSGVDIDISFSQRTDAGMSEANGYPAVSCVLFPTTNNIPIEDYPAPADPYDPVKDGILVYNEKTVGFEGGGKNFTNPYNAQVMANDIKAYYDNLLKLYPDCELYVVGSICQTSPGKEYETHYDAHDRAEAVKKLLVECGIPSEKIHVIDAGTTVLPWRNAVEFPNGQKNDLTDDNQKKNRVVAIIPSYRDAIVGELRIRLGDRFPY